MERDRIILHCDMNNFFASVACLKDPSLRGHPVAVCGSRENRHGIILAKNELAKKQGVLTGEPIFRAQQKCKGLLLAEPRYEEYMEYSRQARAIYGDYTDLVEPFGIDECWLDVTGSRSLFGGGEEMAYAIKERVRSETGLTVSVGVSFNKVFAKLGSDMKKPDAVTCIPRDSFRSVIGDLPAADLLGVGRQTGKQLAGLGIFTIAELGDAPENLLSAHFGKVGLWLKMAAMGLDTSPVLPCDYEIPAKSIGHGTTTFRDMEDPEEVRQVMFALCRQISHRLIACGMRAEGVSVVARENNLRLKQFQGKLPFPTNSHLILAKEAFALFREKYTWQNPLRSVSVTAIGLTGRDYCPQLSLFSDIDTYERAEKLDLVMDGLRNRYGENIITYGVLYKNRLTSLLDNIGSFR